MVSSTFVGKIVMRGKSATVTIPMPTAEVYGIGNEVQVTLQEKKKEDMSQNIITKLRQESRNKHVYGMAKQIALNLGKRTPKSHGSVWQATIGKLYVWFDDYGPNISIHYDKKKVFEKHLDRITRYRPDIPIWFVVLTQIYHENVIPMLKQKEKEIKDVESQEIHDRWGIKKE